MIGHHVEGVQRDLFSELSGSLLFLGDDLAVGAEVHSSLLDSTEEGHSLPRVRCDKVRPAAIVMVIEAAGAGTRGRVDEAFHDRSEFG